MAPNGKLDRRTFLKGLGVTGVGLAATRVLTGCAQPAPQVQQVEVTRVTEKSVVATPSPTPCSISIAVGEHIDTVHYLASIFLCLTSSA
ncbi:MAG: twin-arginine translocation signal domain-containing protein [Holophaga sp.]|nr:twin-arginine translocation signal domain-containing protein [Holophaga sp.]